METIKKVKWVLDPSHSEIQFKVRHLMITNVKGEFRNFTGEINSVGNDFSNASVSINIDSSSIFTNEANRDTHLKSADFFNVEVYKDLTFESTSFKKIDAENNEVTGNLTIKGISREVKLNVEFGGINTDPWGHEKAGFSLEGKISRKDWGLNWNAALETGGVMVSEEVKISAEVQFIKQP